MIPTLWQTKNQGNLTAVPADYLQASVNWFTAACRRFCHDGLTLKPAGEKPCRPA